jgi:translation initiation factor IF-2
MPTRTLTEFSGTLIRIAAKAEAEARKSLPKELTQVQAAPGPVEAEITAQPTSGEHGAGDLPHREPDVEGGPEEASESAAFESATDATDAIVAVEQAAGEAQMNGGSQANSPSVAPAKAAGGDGGAPETDAVKAVLDEAVSKATGTKEERLSRLRDALKVVGGKAERVRLVRVFAGEEPVPGATKIGEHQYTVDLMPQSMKQVFKDPKEEKGRRGPRKPGQGGGKAKQGETLEGSFSMETVAQDRKSERGPGGGRPGGKPGGRGGLGGGRPGGGRPGGAGRPSGGGGRPGAPKP